MKTRTIQRALAEAINLCMALLLVVPIGVLVEQLCGYPLYRVCLIPCLAGIGYILGRISMPRSMTISMVLCGIGTAAALILSLILSPSELLVKVLASLLTTFFSVFFFFSARKAGYTVYAPMAVSGVLLHIVVLIICTGLEWPDQVAVLLSWISIIFFLLCLFSFSSKGLRKSLHKGSGEKRVSYPAGLQMGNFMLVTGFIVVAAFISNIYPIFQLFSRGFSHVIAAIIAFFDYFTSLFTPKSTVGVDPIDTMESAAEDSILNAEPKGEAGWITSMVQVIAFIVVLLVLIYAVYRLILKLRESGVRLPGFLQNLKDRFAPITDEDYIDETESLFDPKEMLGDARKRMQKSLKKLRDRPQRIDDFQDSRTKVRFAYQQLLKKAATRDTGVASRTPNELFQKDFPGEVDVGTFVELYNQAKYSENDLPQDAEATARDIIKKKLG